MPAPAQQRLYTIDDIYALPDGERAELIDGQIFYMAPPSTRHQRILSFLHLEIGNYIRSKGGTCEVFPAPYFFMKMIPNTWNRIYLWSVIKTDWTNTAVKVPRTGLLRLYLPAAGPWTTIQNFLYTAKQAFLSTGLWIH